MFCEHCGTKVEEGAQFCQNCGVKSFSATTGTIEPTVSSPTAVHSEVFYSENWRRRKKFGLYTSYFDVMVDAEHFFVIRCPEYSGAMVGGIIGFLVFRLIGALIGASIGASSDLKRRKSHRLKWLNSDHKLISRDYEKDVYVKVPLSDLKNSLTLGKYRFTIIYGEKKIVLGRTAASFRLRKSQEFPRFQQYIEKYVL